MPIATIEREQDTAAVVLSPDDAALLGVDAVVQDKAAACEWCGATDTELDDFFGNVICVEMWECIRRGFKYEASHE